METILQAAKDYSAGLVSPSDFREMLVRWTERVDRDQIDQFASLLLMNANLRERAEQAMSDAKKLSAGTRLG